MSEPLNKDVDAAIMAYLVGDIEDADLAELDRRVREDPAAARRMAQLCDHEMALATMLNMRQGRQISARSKPVPKKLQRATRRTSQSRLWMAAVAALIVIGVAWVALHNSSVKPAPATRVATVTEIAGTVEVNRPDGKSALKLKAPLNAGDRIAVGAQSRLALSFDDGTTLTLDAGTTLALPSAADQPLHLESGALTASVAHQPAGKPLRIHTAQAEAEIVGTQFRLAIENNATRLDVSEGRVRLTRAADKAVALVDAGFATVATGGTEAPLYLRRLQTLADGLPAQSKVLVGSTAPWSGWEGDVSAPPGTPAGTLAIGSHLPQPGTRFYGEIRSPLFSPEVPSGDHTYLRFRYRADDFKPGDLIKFMLKKKDGTIFHGFLKPEVGNWTVATVRFDGAFLNLGDHALPMKPGESLNQCVFLGAAPDGELARTGPKLWLDDVIVFSAPGDIPVSKLESN